MQEKKSNATWKLLNKKTDIYKKTFLYFAYKQVFFGKLLII